MEFEMFLKKMREKLQDMAGELYRFESRTIDGLNGTEKHSLIAAREGAAICPCINMDDYYRQYREGDDIDDLAAGVLESCRRDVPVSLGDVASFKDWKQMERRVFARLVNTGKNEGLLLERPHRDYLDLSLMYYARIECSGPEECGTVQICNGHMHLWGVDEKTLFQAAWKNMQDAEDAAFESMEDIVSAFFHCPGQNLDTGGPADVQMYVLGSTGRVYGAVHMCNPEALQMASERMGGDFWILPSSVHELILVPLHQAEAGAQGLAEIVREVNDTKVEPQDILSYHVYRYSRAAGNVVIAA